MIKKLQEKGIFKIAVFAVVLLIPVIYSFFYLKAYWNPYEHLTDIKVGIVNLDKGENGKNRGEELLKELQNSGVMNFVEVESTEAANKGLGEDEYYAIITIPEDFTKTLNSASTDNKQISTITYSPNKRKNYLSSQIINSALKTVEINLQSKVSKEVAATLSNGLKDVPDNLQKISDGAEQIDDGAGKLSDGLQKLANGTNTLDNKYNEFDIGIESATKGSTDLTNGICQVNSGIDNLSNGANTLNSAMEQINEGVGTLSNQGSLGINKLINGVENLYNGADNLNSGVSTYAAGTKTLAQGTKDYVEGANTLSEGIKSYVANANNLENGIQDYLANAENLENGIVTYVNGVNTLTTQKNEVLNSLIQYSNANPNDATVKQLATNAQAILNAEETNNMTAQGQALIYGANGLKASNQSLILGAKGLQSNNESLTSGVNALQSHNEDLNEGASQLIAESDELTQGSQKLLNGASQLKDATVDLPKLTEGINTLKIAIFKVNSGTETLVSGASTLKNGTNKVQNGSKELTKGLNTLKTSSKEVKSALGKISTGTNQALEGSATLKDGTTEFKTQINNGLESAKEEVKKLDDLDSYAQDPVQFKEESYGKVDSYGVAFAPLFISIGLWVGALMCYVVLYYDQRHRFGVLDHDSPKSKIVQNALYLAIGAIEGILTGLLLKWTLGYSVVNIGTYVWQCMLAGLVFMSVIQFLIRNFGDIGKFLALIILVLQLAASGGTFPVETIDNTFKGFTNILPMTYTIRVFRDALVATDHSLIMTNTWILIGIFVVINVINLSFEIFKAKRKTIIVK